MFCFLRKEKKNSQVKNKPSLKKIYTYKLAVKNWVDSCCLRVSATWATTPTPALWSHSFFTWTTTPWKMSTERKEKEKEQLEWIRISKYMNVVMGKKGPRGWMKADIDLFPSQLLQAVYHFLCEPNANMRT